jgi:radical SAM superfamily enzyme YgiQ (UPF0313 family)
VEVDKMKNFKIALVNPNDSVIPGDNYIVYENLGLALLDAALRNHGYDSRIIDGYSENIDNKIVAERVIKFHPDLVGFTCTYQSFPDVVKIGRTIKEHLPDVHFTIGGEHATFTAREILNEHEIFNSVVCGEGEKTLFELVKALADKKPLDNINGIIFKCNKEIIKNPGRDAIEDLDSIPFASRHTLDQCSKNGKSILIGMLASRGCYNNCLFCNANKFFRFGGGKALRRRTPQNVVDELNMIYDNYIKSGVPIRLHFYDANFITPDKKGKQWAGQISEEMVKRGIHIPFEIFARADSFDEDDKDLIDLLKKSGLVSVFVGFESVSDQVLSEYNKGVSYSQNIKAVKLLRKHKILGETNGFIMFGPYTTLNELRINSRFILESEQAIFWNLSQRLQLFPGTSLIGKLGEENLLKPGYSPLEVYKYEFKDPRAALLSEKLNFNNEYESIRENSLLRYVKEVIREINILTESSPDFKDDLKIELVESVNLQSRDIHKLNYEFFNQCIDLVEESWSEEIFQQKKGKYLKKLAVKLTKLENIMEEELQKLSTASFNLS